MWTVFTCTIHAQHTWNEFYRTLSIRGTNFIAFWAYAELISSHAEHARKCLKVEYLSRIEYNFQKSRVAGPWDHMVLVSAKKTKKKISCLCTFKVGVKIFATSMIYLYSWVPLCRIAFLDGTKTEEWGHTKALLLHYGLKANLSCPLSPRWVDWFRKSLYSCCACTTSSVRRGLSKKPGSLERRCCLFTLEIRFKGSKYLPFRVRVLISVE